MIKCVLLLSLSILSLSQARGVIDIGDLIDEAERMAFFFCERDRMIGLTWMEVENCEEKYADVLDLKNIPIPTWEDFKAAGLNSDGPLLLEEWEEWSDQDP